MKKILALDYIFLGILVFIITLQPYFMYGAINYYESGIYLPQINEFLHGKVLYRDMFILRGPLEIFMPAYLMQLFGKHIAVLNGYFYFGTVLTLIIYAVFALRVFSTRGFAYLFTLVVVARTFPRVCFNIWGGIRFGLGILAILLAINFLKRKNSFWLFFAGLVSSFAFWTSFEMGILSFISLVAMLCVYGYLEKENIKTILGHMSIYAIGAILASTPFIYYLFLNNALHFYIDSIRVVLSSMTKVFDPSLCFDTPMNLKEFLLAFSPLNHNFKYTLPFFFYLFIAIYLFKGFIKNKAKILDLPIIPVFIYGIFLYKSTLRDIEGPQYRMALQPLLLIMFFYLERFHLYLNQKKGMVSGIKRPLIFFLILLIPLYSVIFSVHKYNKRFFIFSEARRIILNKTHAAIPYADPQPTPLKSDRAKGVIVPQAQAMEIDGVVEYISSHAQAREIVFAFPDIGLYNFLTDRPPLGRFYSAEFSFMEPAWFEEMMADIKSKRPRFVICAKEFTRLKPFMPTVGKYIQKMSQFLQENYKIRKSFETVNVLERKI